MEWVNAFIATKDIKKNKNKISVKISIKKAPILLANLILYFYVAGVTCVCVFVNQ